MQNKNQTKNQPKNSVKPQPGSKNNGDSFVSKKND